MLLEMMVVFVGLVVGDVGTVEREREVWNVEGVEVKMPVGVGTMEVGRRGGGVMLRMCRRDGPGVCGEDLEEERERERELGTRRIALERWRVGGLSFFVWSFPSL